MTLKISKDVWEEPFNAIRTNKPIQSWDKMLLTVWLKLLMSPEDGTANSIVYKTKFTLTGTRSINKSNHLQKLSKDKLSNKRAFKF